MNGGIREIVSDDQIKTSVEVVRESFGTVAKEFGLTKENCPTHPSFVTFDQMQGLRTKGQRFFGLFVGMDQVGFVAAEKGDGDQYYMEKLAVLPKAWGNGLGAQLVHFVLDHACKQGARRLSIGIIDEHTILKNWYKSKGFVETGTKKFNHLPFTVCFMDMVLARRHLSRLPKVVVLDAMGVVYSVGDDVRDLLCPFIVEKGGSSDIPKIEKLYRLASLGQLVASDFWEAVGVDLRAEDEYLQRHRLTSGLTEFLDEVRRRDIQLWCLSNDLSEWSRKLRHRFGLENYFAGFIISGDVGSRKPDVAIFEALKNRLSCSSSDVLFIDDNERNVGAAAAHGFETILFGPGAACDEPEIRTASGFQDVLSLFP